MNQKDLITFNDAAQRTIIAEKVEETAKTLTVKNPVVVNVMPQHDQQTGQPTGQMVLQLLPVFFREFLGDKSADVQYTYPQGLVTQISFEGGFDFRLYAQYEQIFQPPAGNIQPPPHVTPVPGPPAGASPVINLFDD